MVVLLPAKMLARTNHAPLMSTPIPMNIRRVMVTDIVLAHMSLVMGIIMNSTKGTSVYRWNIGSIYEP